MHVLMRPKVLLYVEGAALFGGCLYFYHLQGFAWWIFAVLFLWPDLLMVGYIWNTKFGSGLYNLAHTETLPIAIGILSLAAHRQASLAFSLIWLAHIGLDRALGFGLKYPTNFKDTHLQRVG
jgi:Domain of unknown function (DUF4260)